MEQSIESLDSVEYNTDDTDDSLDLDDDRDDDRDYDGDDNTMIQSIQSIQSFESVDPVENEKGFSKNSIINLARKAGIKAISQQGVDKIKKILNQKIKDTAEKLSIFFMSKNGRTITSKIITQFLESENIYMVD